LEEFISFNTILIIFIILFPGIIIRRSFYNKKFSKQFYRGQFSERLITTIFWGIINLFFAFFLNFLFFKFFYKIHCISCSLQKILYLILNVDFLKNGYILNDIPASNILLFILLFIINIFVIPFALGYSAFRFIRKLKLDLKYSWLTFSNHWHYFFQGEIAHKTDSKIIDKKNLEFRSNENNTSILDILTIEGDEKYLYKGILLDYNLIDDGEDLDSIVLLEPFKKIYDKDINANGEKTILEFEKIPGNFILIPYSNILNINVTIKPFSEITKENSIIVENKIIENTEIQVKEVNINDENKTEDPPFSVQVMFGVFLLLIFYVANNSIEISYLRFTLGLFFVIFFYGFLMVFVQHIIKRFTIKKITLFLILVFIFYSLIIYIFNIDLFNPLLLFLDYFNFN